MEPPARSPRYELHRLESLDELRSIAGDWDDLWRRSEAVFPTAQAETVAQCAEQFAPSARFCALVVSRGDRLLAALPLVGARVKRFLRVGGLPGSAWTPGGDLLVDPDCDAADVLDALVAGFGRLPWPLVWLEAAMMDAPRWHGLCDALDRAGISNLVQERFAVGRARIDHDWDSYWRSRSRNHRRAMHRALRDSERAGRIAFELHAPPMTEDLERLLSRGFAVEDEGWKGATGTSVLRNPGMFAFFMRQARQLAAGGQLAIALLSVDGEVIAFEYALVARNTYAPLKVGYDPRFKRLKPGQLLRWNLFRALEAEDQWSSVDFVGPISDATACWSTDTYRQCRMVIAPSRLSSRLLLAGYRLAQRRRSATRSEPCPLPRPTTPGQRPMTPAAAE